MFPGHAVRTARNTHACSSSIDRGIELEATVISGSFSIRSSALQEPLLPHVSVADPFSSSSTDDERRASLSASAPPVLYAARWWVLFVFCLLAFGQSLIWISFSPITDSTMAYYDVSVAQVDLLLNWGTIVRRHRRAREHSRECSALRSLAAAVCQFYLIFAPLCIHVAQTAKGMHLLIRLSAGFQFFAVVVRLLPEWIDHPALHPYSIYFLHAAHIANALACPPINVTVSKLSCMWMGERERTATTAMACVCNNMGTAAGMLLGPYLVSSPGDIPNLLYVHFGWGCFTLLCTLVYLPAGPPSPPSPAAEVMHAQPPVAFLPALKTVCLNRHLLLLGLGAGVITGVFNTWSSVLETALGNLGGSGSSYDNSTIGWLSFAGTVAGIAGGIASGHIGQTLFWRRRLKALIISLSAVAVAAGAWFALSQVSIVSTRAVTSHSLASVAVSISLLGWMVGSTFPLAFELAAELTYPLPESWSGGFVAVTSNAVGVVFLFIAPSMSGAAMDATMVVVLLGGTALLPFVRETYLRQDAEVQAMQKHAMMQTGETHVQNGLQPVASYCVLAGDL